MATIFSVMEVSANHLPDSDLHLDRIRDLGAVPLPYGWLIFVPSDPELDREAGYPEAVAAILAHARRHRCRYVIIDNEAEQDDPDLIHYQND